MLINAQAAKLASNQTAEANTLALQSSLAKVIQSAIDQGSRKTNFYPKGEEQRVIAVDLLRELGYRATPVNASDQRDRDFIAIEW